MMFIFITNRIIIVDTYNNNFKYTIYDVSNRNKIIINIQLIHLKTNNVYNI